MSMKNERLNNSRVEKFQMLPGIAGNLGGAVTMTAPPRRFLGFCEDVNAYLRGLEPGVEVFGFTSGEFSLIDILATLVREMEKPAAVISTWTAARAEMHHVHEFLETGALASARWIVDRSFQNRQPELCNMLRNHFGDEALRVQRVHCKFVLISDATRNISVQTSANLNRNPRIENVCVSSCPVFFEAYSELVKQIFAIQLPGDGFESSRHVTASFKEVTKKKRRKVTVPNPWAAAG